MPRSNQCARKNRGPSQISPVTLQARESAVRIRMLGMLALSVAIDSVPIAAAIRRSRDSPVMSLTVRRSTSCSCFVHDNTS